MARSSKKKVQHTCFIVTRYFVKTSKSICCIVRNDQGEQYTTCVHANGRTSCTCDAGTHGQKCYHVIHVIMSETARVASNTAATPIALKRLPNATTVATFNMTSAQPTDLGERGSLSSNPRSASTSLVHRKSSSERSLPAIFYR